MHESFLVYRNFRHLKLALSLVLVSLVLYVWHPWHDSAEPPNGGTWLGYVLGTIGAALILWLTWFGVRKRRYSASSRLQGWLSAHVYLGASLIVVATLHTGFQFGWNVHTLAYVLMLTVILSGFYGIYAYARYPVLMTENRGGESLQQMLDEIADLDNEAVAASDRISAAVHETVLRSIERTQVGGTVLQQLSGSTREIQALNNIERELAEMESLLSQSQVVDPTKAQGGTMVVMARELSQAQDGEQVRELRHLLDLLTRKKGLVERVRKDIRFKALMDIWLYIHVPLTFALLAALLAHIVSVFLYW